jgi:hypothetical protein
LSDLFEYLADYKDLLVDLSDLLILVDLSDLFE